LNVMWLCELLLGLCAPIGGVDRAPVTLPETEKTDRLWLVKLV